MEELDLSPEQTALVLIEYQNEWVSDSGSLRSELVLDEEQFVQAITHSKSALSLCRGLGVTVIHVLMKPDKQYKVFGKSGLGLRKAISKSKRWQGFQGKIHPDFLPQKNEHTVTERIGVSAFSGSNLDCFLRNNGITNLILTGFATHVCVESTLRSAHDLGYNTFVVTEATGSFTNMQKRYFSEHVVHHFGKEISMSDLYSLASNPRKM
ncbi:cysteine hydrolase family protein [Vibrio hyugaensis]|uniref:cysteine hydrolase family protein n=1 Tax=Vibrio hyugaensis TaxID=1534743 RepID=UPI003DA0D404